jgi:hypothetical protein
MASAPRPLGARLHNKPPLETGSAGAGPRAKVSAANNTTTTGRAVRVMMIRLEWPAGRHGHRRPSGLLSRGRNLIETNVHGEQLI